MTWAIVLGVVLGLIVAFVAGWWIGSRMKANKIKIKDLEHANKKYEALVEEQKDVENLVNNARSLLN